MKQLWTPKSVYDFLKQKNVKNTLISKLLPVDVYCSENFKWSELLINQVECPTLSVLENLACVTYTLQTLRDNVFGGSAITITSAWRSVDYNKKIGGATNSKHVLGQAVDFSVKNNPPSRVQAYLQGFSGGLGAYKTFTHIDIAEKRRWKG